MSWLSRIVGGGIGETAQAIGSAAKDIEDVFTTSDREELAAFVAETDRLRADSARDIAQIRVNEAQANHPSLFVAGARPAIMWICALAMLYHFVAYPLFGAAVQEYTGYPLGDLNWEELSVVLMGMLGFGGLRSFEKHKGIARENMKKQ